MLNLFCYFLVSYVAFASSNVEQGLDDRETLSRLVEHCCDMEFILQLAGRIDMVQCLNTEQERIQKTREIKAHFWSELAAQEHTLSVHARWLVNELKGVDILEACLLKDRVGWESALEDSARMLCNPSVSQPEIKSMCDKINSVVADFGKEFAGLGHSLCAPEGISDEEAKEFEVLCNDLRCLLLQHNFYSKEAVFLMTSFQPSHIVSEAYQLLHNKDLTVARLVEFRSQTVVPFAKAVADAYSAWSERALYIKEVEKMIADLQRRGAERTNQLLELEELKPVKEEMCRAYDVRTQLDTVREQTLLLSGAKEYLDAKIGSSC